MSIDDQSSDRRQFGRRHTHTIGRVKLPGRGSLPCIVRNLSDGGALLVFDRPEWLPFGFLLTIEGDDTTYGCEVRHHFGERVGVEFVDVAVIDMSSPAAASGSRSSWIAPNSTSRWR